MTHIVKRNKLRPLLALSLVSSMALSSFAATPAYAGGGGGNGNGQIIAGAVAIGLLGLILSDNARRTGGSIHYRGIPHSKRLPAQCLKRFNLRRGAKRFFSESCLQDNFRYWRALPHQCEVTIRYRNNFDHMRSKAVFKPSCLEDWGYHVVGGRH